MNEICLVAERILMLPQHGGIVATGHFKGWRMIDNSAVAKNVSVIMAIRNERGFIDRSLGAVLSQDYSSGRLEVLVVDGMSTDGTREYVLAHSDPRIRLIDNPGKIVSTGLNCGIAAATGDVIVRVDGHTIIHPDYVRSCVDVLVRSGAENVGGCMNAVGASVFGKSVALAISSPFGVGNGRFHYSQKEEFVDTVYLGAWWRSIFLTIGGFDEELVRNQDDEFNFRIRSRGGRVLLSPSIRSEYINRMTPRSLCSQYFQYGFWKVRIFQKYPRLMSARQFIPPLFVLFIVFGLLSPILLQNGLILSLLGASAYAAAALIFGVRVSRRSSVARLLGVVISFFILHAAYGSGFIVGLFHFRNRWGEKRFRGSEVIA